MAQSRRISTWCGILAGCIALACTNRAGVQGTQPAPNVRLDDPQSVLNVGTVPDTFDVLFETNEGDFRVRVHRDWAPIGAHRFYALVKSGFFDEQRFFRVRPGFIAQFGLHPDPKVIASWKGNNMPDDSARVSNTRGRLAYAFITKDTRSTQIFINLADNSRRLDPEGFAPFGEIVQGVDVIDRIYSGYDESAGGGMRAGKQGAIEREGNAHLIRDFPLLDYIKRCRIVRR
jgi:cyclophilin family peptidyl-prolyl cis-trans isomerase